MQRYNHIVAISILTDNSISASEVLTAVAFHFLGDIEFAQGHETRDHVLSHEFQDTQRVTVLDGGVIGVEVLKKVSWEIPGSSI